MRERIVSECMTLDGVLQAPGGRMVFPTGVDTRFALRSATAYPTGVVELDFVRAR